MRVFATLLLSISLASVPVLANDAKDAGKEESSATTAAGKGKEAVKSENAVIESELQDLRSLTRGSARGAEGSATENGGTRGEAAHHAFRACNPSGRGTGSSSRSYASGCDWR